MPLERAEYQLYGVTLKLSVAHSRAEIWAVKVWLPAPKQQIGMARHWIRFEY